MTIAQFSNTLNPHYCNFSVGQLRVTWLPFHWPKISLMLQVTVCKRMRTGENSCLYCIRVSLIASLPPRQSQTLDHGLGRTLTPRPMNKDTKVMYLSTPKLQLLHIVVHRRILILGG